MSLYRPLEAPAGLVRCKLFSAHGGVALRRAADVRAHGRAGRRRAPVRDHAGRTRRRVWIYDFGLQGVARGRRPGPRHCSRRRSSASGAATTRTTASTGSCSRAGLSGRQVTIMRAIAQVPAPGGDRVLGRATWSGRCSPTATSRRCWSALFTLRLDPDRDDRSAADTVVRRDRAARSTPSRASTRTGSCAASCASIRAILRTNYFQVGVDGRPAAYLSFKLDPSLIADAPAAASRSSRSSSTRRASRACICAAGKVARGGLRWSDRREDFRTEILGLMKAQMVKNALIVPVGSKGGFVVKRPPAGGGREALPGRGDRLLPDVPARAARPHRQHRRRRGRAAGPGRALRRRRPVSRRRRRQGHGDVLRHRQRGLRASTASGSATRSPPAARRATTTRRWGSPRAARGSRSSATSASSAPTSRRTDFTVVGIGDMSGDVFGNGMLLSPHIRLLGAFNHPHIFLDPDPDAERELRGAPAPVRAPALVVERLRPRR